MSHIIALFPSRHYLTCSKVTTEALMDTREIKLTAKRQATFPAAVCRELGVRAGDTLVLERREVDGEPAWVLRKPIPDWSWAGSLREYAAGRSHDWESVERSIERGRSDASGS